MKRILIITAALVLCLDMGAWGRRNHAAVAYIAEQHLTPKAYAAVTEVLGGETLMYYASWMDDFRHEETLPGGKAIAHTFHVNKDYKAKSNAETSPIVAMETAVKKLADYKNLDDSTRLACMKHLVHFMGDIHCPAHVRYADKSDKNIGKFEIEDAYGKKVRYHTFWDSKLLEDKFPGGYETLAYVCDPFLRRGHTPKDEAYLQEIQQGSIREWASDVAQRTNWVFDVCPGEGTKLTAAQEQQMTRLAKDQILRAGYRLAKVLNDIFDAE